MVTLVYFLCYSPYLFLSRFEKVGIDCGLSVSAFSMIIINFKF